MCEECECEVYMYMDMYMYVRDNNILSYKTTKIKRESLHCKQFHSKFAWEYFYRSFLFLLLGDVILGNFSREFIEHFEKLSVDGRQLFTRVLDQLPHRDKGTEKEREREGRGGGGGRGREMERESYSNGHNM